MTLEGGKLVYSSACTWRQLYERSFVFSNIFSALKAYNITPSRENNYKVKGKQELQKMLFMYMNVIVPF